MDFFDKLGKTASEAYRVTADKTSKIAKETKMKLRINELRSDIDDKYKEIGKKVYDEYSKDKKTINISKELDEECTFIKEANKEIDDLLQQCLDINDKKLCPNCSAKIEKDVKFCPECGVEQPKQKRGKKSKEDVEPKEKNKYKDDKKEESNTDGHVEVIEEVTVEKVPEKTSLQKTTEVEISGKEDDDKKEQKEVIKKVTKVNTKKVDEEKKTKKDDKKKKDE